MSIQEHVITALGAALEGSRVGFFAATHDDARAAFKAVDALAPNGCEIRRTNGRESIGTPQGGSIRFLSVRSTGHRGLSLDRVYVPAELAGEDFMAAMVPCLVTSKDRKIIGYL